MACPSDSITHGRTPYFDLPRSYIFRSRKKEYPRLIRPRVLSGVDGRRKMNVIGSLMNSLRVQVARLFSAAPHLDPFSVRVVPPYESPAALYALVILSALVFVVARALPVHALAL